ncbi:hypothetical protein [Janthinobacterium sp. RA13]|uniref:hypothetical protein n=1 Tax=Janthinobacterium sp. RA13 TaxID=1502762 RepID=UPI00126A5754|nr:hypothetical protein [Janthinobacterium sp. RA13]
MKTLFFLFLLLVLPMQAKAGNPGNDASRCVSTSAEGEAIWFENTCQTDVFVMYCGELLYDKKTCGSLPGGGYFTHTKNLKPGARDSMKVKKGGSYRYGACVGGVGFGRDGWIDKSDGSYECTPTGNKRR